jgi:hypothetical protein
MQTGRDAMPPTSGHTIASWNDQDNESPQGNVMIKLFVASALAIAVSCSASAATVSAFADNFENGLSQWVDRNPSSPEAGIFVDPLNASNHVLGFNTQGSGGSIYTIDLVTTTGQFTVSFDYLGVPSRGGVAGDLGGFFGISQDFPGSHYWVAGTQDGYGQQFLLDDDGTWHHYSVTFSSPVGQSVHLMFEDFVGSGGVAGDAYFDNIQFNDAQVAPAPLGNSVPEPGSLALLSAALIAAATRRKRT